MPDRLQKKAFIRERCRCRFPSPPNVPANLLLAFLLFGFRIKSSVSRSRTETATGIENRNRASYFLGPRCLELEPQYDMKSWYSTICRKRYSLVLVLYFYKTFLMHMFPAKIVVPIASFCTLCLVLWWVCSSCCQVVVSVVY
ncbi:hypothetical protein BJ742DRAFT_845635 [Cladochytrium replicatum]|nr:hypothetical protein BJ742DRAFT_845635 [Cladochytrium replicatum]